MEGFLTLLTCLRCNWRWIPRKEGRPARCPRCTSTVWDKPKDEGTK